MKTAKLSIGRFFWSMHNRVIPIFIAVILANIVLLQLLTYLFSHTVNAMSEASLLSYSYSMLLVCVVTVVILVIDYYSLLVSLGVSRQAGANAVLKFVLKFSLFWVMLVNVIFYFIHVLNKGSFLLPLIAGINNNQWTLINILHNSLIWWFIGLVVSYLILWISAVFLCYGAVRGLTNLALTLSLPLFYLQNIIEFFEWGVSIQVLGLISLAVAGVAAFGSKQVLQKVEIKK